MLHQFFYCADWSLGSFAKIVGLEALLYLSKSTASTVLAGSNEIRFSLPYAETIEGYSVPVSVLLHHSTAV